MRYAPEHKEGTRARLVKATGALAKRQGFSGTGIDGLMAAAGLTSGAFYAHFRSKNELLEAIVDNALICQIAFQHGGSVHCLPTSCWRVGDHLYIHGANNSRMATALLAGECSVCIAHLDGLNLSRAWCWRGLAKALGPEHPVAAMAGDVAERHLSASLPHVTGDYMGEHWLASFALLALEG